ncbi:glycosyltransferase [Caproicibacterium sp. BJN0003]|uniref:glycosyltransferase n=1 Tax=Caproicibacterium sp. BJN0003 TaxID=2994078 RepID=UPI0022553A2B|nr:glycosyltransferase [Caproicibacterium sp. BJN0003]UZT82624.1 GtrA family protein [Caproicibacterium sp. BJN0003]
MIKMEKIPIVIPAYEPDNRLIKLLQEFNENDIGPVILVNDGSCHEYDPIFEKAERLLNEHDGVLLKHPQNMGKGRALKTAFSYIINNYQNAIGAITADSDGQHTVECIKAVMDAFYNEPKCLVLGVRQFNGAGIPWKSRFGNNLTKKVFAVVSGVHVSDTQTGLRGIPISFMEQLLEVKGDRFEFEMQMLLESAGKYNIVEIPIKTVYDSEENHQTHFNPIKDSIKIYRILGKKILKYIFSSFSSSIIDLILFSFFCLILKNKNLNLYVAISTVLARIISATYNYFMNYKVVFKSSESIKTSGIKYAMLAAVQMSMSAFLVTTFVRIFSVIPEVVVKIIIDTILFFVSYHIQQRYIFFKS